MNNEHKIQQHKTKWQSQNNNERQNDKYTTEQQQNNYRRQKKNTRACQGKFILKKYKYSSSETNQLKLYQAQTNSLEGKQMLLNWKGIFNSRSFWRQTRQEVTRVPQHSQTIHHNISAYLQVGASESKMVDNPSSG